MKKKQMLAMLLAALMTLSVPLVAFAEGEPTDPNTADLVQPYVVDNKAPELKEISINSNSINAGNPVIITIKATDNLSGINDCGVQFYSEDSDKKLLGSSCEIKGNTCTITIDISEYAPNRRYNLEFLSLTDKAGNTVYYAEDPINDDRPLPQAVYFTVINDGSVPTPPTNPDKPVTPPAPEQKPFQPSYSTGSSASGSYVTSVKPAPAASGSSIKQEEKDRQFWKNKQDQIRKAANGKKIRIFIPKETTRVPASFLESIRTAENDITVELRWNGKKITITPETALTRSPRRVFWNLKTLLEYYHA